MASYRSELFVPISRDKRTFDQQQRDVFSEMEHVLEAWHRRGQQSSSPSVDSGISELQGWSDVMSGGLEDRRRKWETEIQKMREEMISLRSHDSPRSTPISLHGVTPKVTITSNVPGRDGKLKSFTFDQMQTQFLRGDDGLLHYQVHFDVKDFRAEDLKVVAKNSKLTVSARHEIQCIDGSSFREFNRSIDLPQNVDHKRLSSTLTNDGILVIDVPVPTPHHSLPTSPISPKFIAGGPYYSSGSSSPKSPNSVFDSGPIFTTARGERKLKFEVPIGNDYGPGEINVKTQDSKVYIHARHEEKMLNRTSFREFSKEYDIPNNVDPYDVTAKLENGVLYIEAPVKFH